MKIVKKSFANRVWSYQSALIAILVAGAVVQSEAQIYTVNYTSGGNAYSATYDTSQNGFTVWSQNGANELSLQSLYYSIDGGPVSELTGASVTTGNAGSGKKITVNFTISDGTIQDVMTLIGNTLTESIVFDNTSGGALAKVSIFQYSDFVLGGAVGNQTVSMTPAVDGGYAYAYQSGGGLAFNWNGDVTAGGVSGTTLVQANGSGAPFGAFVGPATDLDNVTLGATNTSAVFGYEFYGSVGASNSLLISENAAFPVPEPSSSALIVTGMLAFGLALRQRRSKKSLNYASD